MEFAGATIIISSSTILGAAVIGFLLSYLMELNLEPGLFSEKISLINTAMLELELEQEIRTEVSKFIISHHTVRKIQTE